MTASSAVVLMVDHDITTGEAAQTALAAYGYTVLVAESGEQAIDTLRCIRVDVVVLNMTMPEPRGEMMLLALLMLQPEIKVVLSDGYVDPTVAKSFSGQLKSTFLPKPYTPEQIAEHVRFALLGRSEGDSCSGCDDRQVPEMALGSVA